MKTKKSLMRLSLITIAVMSYCSFASAQGDSSELDTINVNGSYSSEDVKQKKVGETVKTAKELKKQQVQDSRDLVRYETGISVVENGRFGSSGYSVRGVDENRVAITIDGLHQAETLSSQGFKELFEGYGNFNNTRNSVEIETLKQVSISKGSNSVKVGSGALGGAVIFETKDARDLLIDKDWHVSYKTGYNSADNQNMDSITLAGRYKWFDAIIIKTKRDGHELKNYGYKNYPNVNTKIREKADPYNIIKESSLVKLSVSPTENHRLTVIADLYKNNTNGQDLSYSLNATPTQPNEPNTSTRHAKDSSERKNYAISYENYSSNPLWDTLKITYSEQKVKNRARTEDYCDEDSCKGTKDPLANPLGIALKNGKIVDKNGDPITLKATKKNMSGDFIYELVDKNDKAFDYPNPDGTVSQSAYFNLAPIDGQWFDCSLFDCDKPIEYYELPYYNNGNKLTKKSINLKKEEFNGKFFARREGQSYLGPNKVVILPNSVGYLERNYHDRSINTNTKQLNLDLSKAVDISNIMHNIDYGLSYSKIRKEMINYSGYDAKSPQWWAERFLGTDFFDKPKTCESSGSFNALLCPKVDGPYSFLIPVVTKNSAVYLSDNFKLSNHFSFDVGYRYDRIRYNPHYVAGSTPKIPDDLVAGLAKNFVPPHKISNEQPKYYDGYNGPADPKFLKDLKEWQRKNEENKLAKHQADIDSLAQPNKYSASSYSLSMNFDPTDYLRIQLHHAKGFRAPTSDEIYFTFKHPDFTVLPNLNLKSEKSKTQEVAITYYGDFGFISTSLFQTKYRDFIDLKYLGSRNFQTIHGGQARAHPFQVYQNVNRQTAKVKGVEINSKLYLNKIHSSLDGFSFSYKFSYQKGRTDGNIPMNAIQPKTSVYGLSYQQKEDKFGIDIYLTHVGEKKAKDSYNMYYMEQGLPNSNLKWRSKSYTVTDIIAYAKPLKNLKLQFGIYNLTNRKYITWESARSIKPYGTSNLIDQNTGKGINRFYSPGRNFKFNMEFVF
ncbi:Hemoglobin and hemoglobin-haptoglobin binding protein B [Canicola haemoglobinophilus]|uniref:Hemoglobin and hemoglobin-haptoglobin binding protein B n=1 Tax=Canicola haemoglobinophilus TaxID=733 RepID=A0AB38HAT0_9PAST|nr:TonB-dependent hemoglobin/transferrin/lactoferrin family receptor [Canicola haemoglobinophilus]STO55204.1 Hemoglobin and hemoglobin-haptoglobin binding protein B [Canicola haemoglobinophilus]STO69226.1 Hemoglobin and hemoglobin-haptoglobin binding protein B [Canicola haemoglobinophilus]